MGAKVYSLDLVLNFVVDPSFYDIFGEDIAFQEEFVICFQGYECFAQGPRGFGTAASSSGGKS